MIPVTSAKLHSAPFTLSTIEDNPMPSVGFTHALPVNGELVAVYFFRFRYCQTHFRGQNRHCDFSSDAVPFIGMILASYSSGENP